MIRLLLVAVIVYVVWRTLRAWWRQLSSSLPPDSHTPKQQPVPMLRCDHCHIHFPATEAVRADNRVFCSTTHLEDWRQQQ